MTRSQGLRLHSQSVQVVMEALARRLNEDVSTFAITGLLHDADYEIDPVNHPQLIVDKLRNLGEPEIAHAIAGHNTSWKVPRISPLDKAIVAADKMTGFVTAVVKSRPTGIDGLTSRPVIKKMKNKKFAASVDREEIRKGAKLLNMELPELADIVIDALRQRKEELQLVPKIQQAKRAQPGNSRQK